MRDQPRKQGANHVRLNEEPDVPRVRLPKQGAHPVRADVRITRSESLAELSDRQIGPPEEIGMGLRELQVGRGTGKHRRSKASTHAPVQPATCSRRNAPELSEESPSSGSSFGTSKHSG